jgi:hypothetical protein
MWGYGLRNLTALLIQRNQGFLLLSSMAEKSLIYPANDLSSSDDLYDPDSVRKLDR